MPAIALQDLHHYYPLEFNSLHGPINEWKDIQLLQRPTFNEVLMYSSQLMQGDVCISRTDDTRQRYNTYAVGCRENGRQPIDDILEKANGYPYLITENLFPYDLADAEHWLLFMLHKDCTIEGAQHELVRWSQENGVSLEKVFAYQNPYGLRSIPEFPHFQLIIKTPFRSL